MKFPVDLLADVSQTELEHLAHNCMNNLLYSNPDSPERLTLSDSTQVTIDISSVGFVPLYGSSDKQKILALFSPSDPFTAVALYLLDQWWAVDDILKTADPARHGAVEVETVGERIVLYILNRVIYRAKEMSSDELPFLCHGEKDHAKILWNNGEAVGFYSVKPSGSLCNSFSTRSYQLPVMDSIFVRKCQRGKGFGLQMLEDFVLSFKEDCLGLRYPLLPSMYKVCEKYLCQYPGDTGLLWEVEGIGGPNQRTNIASRIQAMEQSAVSKNLSFTEESLVITQMTEKGVAMEAVTTQIKDAESVECTVEIVEEVTVLSATIEAEVPLTARGRSSGSKRRKTGEKIAEDKPEKVLRIEDIEAETPRGEQVSAQQETELHNVSELVQTEGMISVAPEGQGEDAVDTVPEETVRVLDQPATVLSPQDLEEADVTLAPMTEEPQVENDTPQDLTSTSRGSQITVENVASEIEEAEKEYRKEDTAVLVISEEVLEVHKGAETLDKVGEKTQIGDTGEKLKKKVTQHEVSLLTYATSEDGEAGRTGKTRRTVVKAIKTVQSETPRRRSKRQHKLQEGLKEESTVQAGDLILRGRTVTKTPTSKRKNPCCSQKVSEELEKEANEVADENEVSTTDVMEESAVIEREQEEMTSVKRDVVDVEELTEEKQQLKDEQLANDGEAKKQHQPGVKDTVVKGCSTELPNIAETALTKENEDEKVTDESQKIQKGEKAETSVIGDKQDVSDDEIQEPPVAQKKALTGRLKVTPKPQPTRQSKRHQKQKAEHTDEADMETGGSAGEEKADEQPTYKQIDEHHKDEQEETADKTEEDISIKETTVLKKSRIQTEKTAEDVIPSTEVNVEGTKEVQEMEETEGEAEKEKESVSVFRKGGCSAAATARLKIACTQCQTEEEEEEKTEETEREEEETGQELSEEKGEGVGEEEKSVEMEKDKDVEDEVERVAGEESAIGDTEQMKDVSAEEAAVLEEEDNSVKAVDEISTHTVQISPAEVEERNSAKERQTTVLEIPTAATEGGSDTAITEEEELVGDASVVPEEEAPAITTKAHRSKIKTSPATPSRSKRQKKDQGVVETQQQEEENPEEEQHHELTHDSPPRSVRQRPRMDSSVKGEVDEQGETEAATDKEESDDDKDNKKAKSSADEPKEKLDNLDIDNEVETTGISQKDEDNKQNMSEEELEPIVIGKRVLRGRSLPSVTVTPQPKSRRQRARAQKAEESLSDEEMSTQLAQAEENTQPEVEMEKVDTVAQESVTEQETVKEEQSAVSETCAEGQEVASVGESSEKTPNADKGMVSDKAEASPVETVVRRSGEKTVTTTRSKTTKGQDDEQKQLAVKKSTEEGELAVETRFFRRGRRSAAATAKQKSKRARTQCQTEEEGEEESHPAEETEREEGETWQKLPEEKREEVEEEEESVEMEKDKDVEDEVESTAGGEFAIGGAEQMKDASTEEAAVLEEEDNSDKDVDEISTDTVQISPGEVGETNSAEEEDTTVLEKPTVAPDVGSDTAIVSGVAGDMIQEPDTAAATLEAVIPDIVLGEADASAAGEPQEKDIGSEIPKLQKATIILVDIKTTCHHLSVKEAEETPVARVHAASEKQQEEENGDKQENIKEKSVEATVETETSKKEELEEDNSEKEKDESAGVDEEMRGAEEALVTEEETVESSCESTSRSDQQKEEDNTGEGIAKNEMDEVETGTDEVEEEMESVAKDAVIVIVPVEKKQSAVSEICREADIPAGDDAEGNLPPAEVDKAMSSEEEGGEGEGEEEALVVETRALKHQTKPSKATPKRKSTRRRKQGDAQEEENNNREEQLAVTTRRLRSGRISASDTQKGKSRRSCKQIQEGGQNVEEKTQSVNKTRVEEDEAVEPAIEKTDKEMEDKDEIVEKFEEEAATERVEDLEPEIDVEDGKAVAMQAQDGVEEQLESIFKTFAKKEVEASGEECDERKPAMGREEMELLPDAVTRSLRSGQKMSKASPKNKSRQSKKQQDELKEGGASAEKSTDGNEPPAETRILRGGRKSVCGIHEQLKKEEDGLKESGEEAGVVEEEEARLGSVKEPPTEVDEGKVPEEDKTEMENEEFVPVEVRKGVSEEGTMEITEDEENTAGDAADADELVQGETDTPLPELATEPAVLSPSKEEATHSAEDQQSEEMAPKLSDLQRLTVVLVDVQKKHHDIKEVTAAARLMGSVQNTATNIEEEQKEERAAEEKVTGFPLGTEKNELEKVTVEEEEFQDDVKAVTTKDTGEGIAEETAKEEEAKSINDEQEPIITETRTCRSKKQAVKATPSTKLARSGQKTGELAKEASTIQKVQTVQTVQIRVLRRGRMFRPVTQKCATKRTHKQLQEREEVEGGEKSTAVEERVEEEKQHLVIDQEKKEKLKERDVTEQVEHIEAEMGMDKENILAEEAVIQQEEEQVNSTETAGNEETGASAGQHADEGKAPDVAEEAVLMQDTVGGGQLTSASKEVESAAGVSTQETLLTAKDDKANNVSEKEEATVTERVLRSGEKTVRDTRRKTTKRQKDEQEETAVEKSTKEDELAVETRILRKGRRFAAATARLKSKRACTQCQTEEEGEEETPPAEETGGEEGETRQGLPEEKGEEVEDEERGVEMEKDKDVEDEEVESAAGEEFAIGDAAQMKDASTEEVAVLEEEDKSDKDVDDMNTHTVQISSAEEEETTVIEKVTDATEVGSDTALTEEEEIVGDASEVPEEEAPATTTRAPRSKIKTSPVTPSQRSKRQKDQGVVETQQQEEEDPEEEQDYEVIYDSPPRSVQKRPRVDSSEKEEADERSETEAATDKEESDDDKDNKKAKSSADEPKEKLDNLYTDREVETAGISQKDDDNEQDMSEEKVEPIMIGKRVLRGRTVAAVIITPQPKSRRRSAKAQTAEESLSDEEKNIQLAQTEENTELEVEMEKVDTVVQESVTEQEIVKEEQSAVSETCAEGQELVSVGERAEETPNADKGMVADEEETPTVVTGVLRSGEKTVRITRSKTRKGQDDEQEETAVEKSTEEDELAVETRILRKGRRSAASTARQKSKRACTQCQTEEEGEEETPPAEETGGEEEETRQRSSEEKGEEVEEEEKNEEMEKDKDVEDEVERAFGGESTVGDAKQMKDASAEEAAALEEEDNSVKAVDDISTNTVQISPGEVGETNSAEEEETTVLEKPTAATEVGSDTAITEEEELVGDASVVPEEEAPAITTRGLRSKIKTSPATPSRSKRQKHQEVVETQQQEEENLEEQNDEVINDSPPRSVQNRPRVDSSEKGEADEQLETEATTDKEESDDDKDNKKVKSSADEPKEKLDNLDRDREVETIGISQQDEDNEQNMSKEEVEPIVIGKRVLRGRSVSSVTVIPKPKSRRRSVKVQKAEESLSDEERTTQLAQAKDNTEPEVEMEKVDTVAQESVTGQMIVEEEQSAASETCAEGQELVSVGERAEETPNTDKGMVTDKAEAPPVETVVRRSGEKTVRTTRSKTAKRQDDEQEESAVEKSTEELAVETRILRKGKRSAASTARQKSKRARTQCQTEEEGEEETPPAEETGGEEEEPQQGLPEKKGEEVEEEEKSEEMEKDKDVENEVERAVGGESTVGDAKQMKDASAEEAAALEEEDNSVKAVDDISTNTVQISPGEVGETNSAEEEETTVLEKSTAATEVGSDTAITEEEELVGDASVVPEEEPPAITARVLRSKIKTSPATPSRSKRQKDQEVVETQQQEEENFEEEQDDEVTNDSPPRSVQKRPRVDSSEKGEVDEQRETEATTDKEESDDDKDNKKVKSSADEPKEKLDNLDRHREVETIGISQKDEDNEQNMSKEEVEPIVIGKRVLRGRLVSSVTVTPQPKSRRRSAKVQKAEESLSDEEKTTQLAQAEENTQPEVEMEKLEAVAQESVTEQETVKEEQSAVSETCAEGQELVSVGERAEETPNADKGMVTDEEEAPTVVTGVLRSGEKTVRITRSKTRKGQDDEQEETAVEKSTEEDELAVETRILRKGGRSAAATARLKSKRACTQCQTEEEGEEETPPAEETGGEEEETRQELPEEKGEEVEEEEKSVEMEKDKDVEDEEVESAAGEEFAIGDAEQMKDASTEEAAVLEKEDKSDKDVDDISTHTVQISSAEVEETNSSEEEETTVIEKVTDATEVGSDTAITEEEELVGSASVVPEEAPAITTRGLRSKIKTSPATSSRRSKRQKDQEVVETQQQEEDPEEEQDHEVTNDSPPRSVPKRPRVDSSGKGEADEQCETDAATEEESDDNKDNKKAKSYADEPKEKLDNLDRDREVETAGISQKDEDNEQDMSEEEVEPITIGKRVLRGRTVAAVTVTHQPKSRRCSAKVQTAEESLSDEEENAQFAQKRKSTEVTATRKSKRLSRN